MRSLALVRDILLNVCLLALVIGLFTWLAPYVRIDHYPTRRFRLMLLVVAGILTLIAGWGRPRPSSRLYAFSSMAIFQVCLLSVLVCLLLVTERWLEGTGRRAGFDPAMGCFQLTDSLYITDQYYTDSLGIMRANAAHYASQEGSWSIDSNGFRNNHSYTVGDTSKKKILLLGDSFTWGMSADPLSRSFADLLAQQGYGVYNTGISSADPVQYDLICQQLAPALTPDIICVAYCMYNDLLEYDRPPMPGISTYFWTNVGMLSTENLPASTRECAYVYWPGAQQMYDDQIRQHTLFTHQGWWARQCARTIIGSFLYFRVQGTEPQVADCSQPYDPAYTRRHLSSIAAQAKAIHARMVIAIIPDKDQPISDREKLNEISPEGLFDGYEVLICPGLTRTDYAQNENDRHFNNEGHKKFADYLRKQFR